MSDVDVRFTKMRLVPMVIREPGIERAQADYAKVGLPISSGPLKRIARARAAEAK
jgi:hypothetical protein